MRDLEELKAFIQTNREIILTGDIELSLLTKKIVDYLNSLIKRSNELKEMLDKLKTLLNDEIDDFENEINTKYNNLVSEFNEFKETINNLFNDFKTTTNNDVNEFYTECLNKIEDTISDLTGKLNNLISEHTADFNEFTTSINNDYGTFIEVITGNIQTTTNNLYAKIDEYQGRISSDYSNLVNSTNELISQKESEVGTALANLSVESTRIVTEAIEDGQFDNVVTSLYSNVIILVGMENTTNMRGFAQNYFYNTSTDTLYYQGSSSASIREVIEGNIYLFNGKIYLPVLLNEKLVLRENGVI